MTARFDALARAVSRAAGRPWAFAGALLLVLGWAAAGPAFGWSEAHSLAINTATTCITFLMVFLIQHAQDTDTTAMQKKLDELIRAVEGADNRLRGIERRPDGRREDGDGPCPICGEPGEGYACNCGGAA